MGKIFHFGEASQIINFSLALVASLQLDWATSMGRLLGPFTCLTHKDGDIPFGVLAKDTTSNLAGLFSTLSVLCYAPSKESCEYHF